MTFAHRLSATFGLALCASLPVTPALAQQMTYGLSSHATVLSTGDKLGAGDLLGAGGRLSFGPNPYFSLGLGADTYLPSTLQGGRQFQLISPTVDLTARFGSEGLQSQVTLAPTVHLFRLGATEAREATRKFVPALNALVGLSVPVIPGVRIDVSGGSSFTYSKPGILAGTTLASDRRAFDYAPQLKAGISLHFRKREKVAKFEDLPLSLTEGLQPVRASSTQDPNTAMTQGREHVHVSPETMALLDPPHSTETLAEDMLLGTVFFNDGSFVVETKFHDLIKKIATYMKDNPETRLRLKGYTTPSGGQQSNLSLAERRANSVRYQLVYFHGVAEERVEALTGGIDSASNKDVARRVEAWLMAPSRSQ